MTEGLHKDQESLAKPPIAQMLPWDALDEVIRVLHHGAKKHGLNNWRKGKGDPNSLALLRDAMTRHLIAYMRGEEIDPESGAPHLAHLVCNAMFLVELERG